MAEYLRNKFVDPCKWYGARLAFTRTAATMSMVGFILGLGDRNCENILLDSTNGDIVHVDFNMLFNRGEYLETPEVVPFRLTRNMIDGFGSTGVEGAFRKTCETVLRVLRHEQATLRTVFETFLHDPLVEWSKVENRNQLARGAQKNAVAANSISLIKARLDGKIVTQRFHKQTKSSVTMSVEGQVAQLIKMATDRNYLAQMYIGWNPHL
uniref:Non-specific serine/threonine protein kinase n=1 Tax=Panagrolaimus sp. PS1159 TaxID=55785 RepID=A0AC35GX03_9BILA